MDSSTPRPLHTLRDLLSSVNDPKKSLAQVKSEKRTKNLAMKYNHNSSTPLPLHTLRDLFKVRFHPMKFVICIES
ncbi:4004_t:CDS:2 [Dentiscutata erythropus]|uniref:4004_t:CDS:1 n=1 Tax=Dentiscutata erythropus TaxID=1348616 RepID=A0A9N9AEP8_9GLOM|nr:4004_t:CDS:2 [Dentiscutata erythropus]